MTLLLSALLLISAQKSEAFDSRKPELRRKHLEQNGGSEETEAAAEMALLWLAKHQRADGTWAAEEGENTLGLTALSLLAFLGTGRTPKSPDFGREIGHGVQWLLAQQAGDGLLGPAKELKNIYGHIVGTTVLAELAGMTGEEAYRLPAQRAIDKLLALQNPGRAWRYDQARMDDDSSVTGWALEALHTAEAAGLRVPASAAEGAIRWFDSVTDDTGRTGYRRAGDNVFILPGLGEAPDNPLSRTAFSVLARWRSSGHLEDPRTKSGLSLLRGNAPSWDYRKIDFCFFFIASTTLLTVDGAGGTGWRAWNQALQLILVRNQVRKGADAGTWNGSDWWSLQGGRVYGTAINALTLEVYYRTLPRRGR